MTFRFDFEYPQRRSSFETVLHSTLHPDQPLWVHRIRTSPGYNTSTLARHSIAVHLGKSVIIGHARERSVRLDWFRPGDAIFIPTGNPIHYAHAETVDALYIDVLPAALNETAAQIGIDPQQLRLVEKLGVNDPFLFRIGNELLGELSSPLLGGQLYFEALSMQIMIHLLRNYATSSETPVPTESEDVESLRMRFRPVIDYVQAHYDQDISLKELAHLVYLTPAHFSRLFKRAYGFSPYQYVIQQRVEAARQLLSDPSLTVTDVALRVGFADHSHLIRHYKRVIGTTPRV
jgi:AraC family transcriptional regulator